MPDRCYCFCSLLNTAKLSNQAALTEIPQWGQRLSEHSIALQISTKLKKQKHQRPRIECFHLHFIRIYLMNWCWSTSKPKGLILWNPSYQYFIIQAAKNSQAINEKTVEFVWFWTNWCCRSLWIWKFEYSLTKEFFRF